MKVTHTLTWQIKWNHHSMHMQSQAKQVISTIQNVIGIIEGAEEPDRTASGTFHDGDLLLNLKGLRLKSEEKQTALYLALGSGKLNLNFLRVKITEDLDDETKEVDLQFSLEDLETIKVIGKGSGGVV
ncbi:hypothetical protein Tco_0662418 [Tanacetum coccineum]